MVRLVELHFPATAFGLPDGCENIDMIPAKDLLFNFMEACAALREPLKAHFLEQQHLPPSCIISDYFHWWTGDIARELAIPRLTFSGFSGYSSLVRYNHKMKISLVVNFVLRILC
jgi:UDP-glucosyl transferase 73C